MRKAQTKIEKMSKSFKTEKQRMNKLMKKMNKTVQDFKKKIEEKNNSGNDEILRSVAHVEVHVTCSTRLWADPQKL